MPFRVLYALSDGLYLILYYVVGYRRKVVKQNLKESFPDKSDKEIKAIEKRFYRYFSDNLLEICKMGSISHEEMKKRMHFVNVDVINKRLREGHSIAVYLGHYGNWEWVSSLPLSLDNDVTAAQIYHRLSNPAIDKVMLENRASCHAVNVEMRETARFINRKAMNNEVCITGFIADQSPRKKDAKYFLHFLNHEIPVITATEKIIKHYNLDTFFLKVSRVKRGYYEAEFISMSCETESEFELTHKYFSLLEQTIIDNPEYYLWTHRRFKLAKKN